MTSQRVERTWIRTGGYGRFRGEWVKILDMADSEDEPQEAKKAKVDRTSRSTYERVDWSICIFCQKKKYKGVKELLSVASFDSCQAIVDATIARDDQRLHLRL